MSADAQELAVHEHAFSYAIDFDEQILLWRQQRQPIVSRGA